MTSCYLKLISCAVVTNHTTTWFSYLITFPEVFYSQLFCTCKLWHLILSHFIHIFLNIPNDQALHNPGLALFTILRVCKIQFVEDLMTGLSVLPLIHIKLNEIQIISLFVYLNLHAFSRRSYWCKCILNVKSKLKLYPSPWSKLKGTHNANMK